MALVELLRATAPPEALELVPVLDERKKRWGVMLASSTLAFALLLEVVQRAILWRRGHVGCLVVDDGESSDDEGVPLGEDEGAMDIELQSWPEASQSTSATEVGESGRTLAHVRGADPWAVAPWVAVVWHFAFFLACGAIVVVAFATNNVNRFTGLAWEYWGVWLAVNAADALVQTTLRATTIPSGVDASSPSVTFILLVLPGMSVRIAFIMELVFLAVCAAEGFRLLFGIGLVVFVMPWPRLYLAYTLQLELRDQHLPFLVPETPDTPGVGFGTFLKKLLSCQCRNKQVQDYVKGIGVAASSPIKQELTIIGNVPQTVVQSAFEFLQQGSIYVFASIGTAVVKFMLLLVLGHGTAHIGTIKLLTLKFQGSWFPHIRLGAIQQLTELARQGIVFPRETVYCLVQVLEHRRHPTFGSEHHFAMAAVHALLEARTFQALSQSCLDECCRVFYTIPAAGPEGTVYQDRRRALVACLGKGVVASSGRLHLEGALAILLKTLSEQAEESAGVRRVAAAECERLAGHVALPEDIAAALQKASADDPSPEVRAAASVALAMAALRTRRPSELCAALAPESGADSSTKCAVVRRLGILCAGRVSAALRGSMLSALLQACSSPEAEVKRAAADSLGALGVTTSSSRRRMAVMAALVELIEASSAAPGSGAAGWPMRLAACEALGAIARVRGLPPIVTAVLNRLLTDPDEVGQVKFAAHEALYGPVGAM